jgi:hypothetical protein
MVEIHTKKAQAMGKDPTILSSAVIERIILVYFIYNDTSKNSKN